MIRTEEINTKWVSSLCTGCRLALECCVFPGHAAEKAADGSAAAATAAHVPSTASKDHEPSRQTAAYSYTVRSKSGKARQGKANICNVLILYKEFNLCVGDNMIKKQMHRAIKVSKTTTTTTIMYIYDKRLQLPPPSRGRELFALYILTTIET
jgi:hypothetical protein